MKMTILKCLLLVVFLLVGYNVCYAEMKPHWVGNTPKEGNNTYKFVEIISQGSSLESARSEALNLLAENEQLKNGVRVNRVWKDVTDIDTEWGENEPMKENIHQHTHINLTIDGEQYNLLANKIDEYIDNKDGIVLLHTLFQVATCKNPIFDSVYISDKYGAAPVVLSLIPGAGQFYKGDILKGSCILGSEIVGVVSILFCENQRATYAKKVLEQPRFAKEYNTKSNNWAIGRNICVGAVVAMYVYNLLDAALSGGARKVVFGQSSKLDVSFIPVLNAEDNCIGLSFNCKF